MSLQCKNDPGDFVESRQNVYNLRFDRPVDGTMSTPAANKPLAGIRLIDLTHMLSGPYAGMILADLGCDTVKVEPPGRGEGTRRLLEDDPSYSIHGMGAYFFTLNRNKRSVAIDLKSEAGLEFFYELVRHADVVLGQLLRGRDRAARDRSRNPCSPQSRHRHLHGHGLR